MTKFRNDWVKIIDFLIKVYFCLSLSYRGPHCTKNFWGTTEMSTFFTLHIFLSQIQGMMSLAGFAYSCMVVSSFSRAQKRVLDMGFADDINTYVMISGKFIDFQIF